MTQKVVTVRRDTTLDDVVRLMLVHRISSLPAMDNERLFGILSENDLLRRPEIATERARHHWLQLFSHSENAAADYVRTHGLTAGEVMTIDVVSVTETAGVEELPPNGGGGLLMRRLIARVLRPAFAAVPDVLIHDGAVFNVGDVRLAFTTDSYVVRPLFFAGGDIGTLAVNGTVNDLAMCGARPLYLSIGPVLEEWPAVDDRGRRPRRCQRRAGAAKRAPGRCHFAERRYRTSRHRGDGCARRTRAGSLYRYRYHSACRDGDAAY